MIKNRSIIYTILIVFPFVALLILSFKEKQSKLFSFGIIADCQYADIETKGTRYYRNSLSKLQETINEFNKHELEFVIHLGDFIEQDSVNFEKVSNIYNNIRIPQYHVIGNHDLSSVVGGLNCVISELEMNKDYYDFKIKDWYFIVLNGMDLNLVAQPAFNKKQNEAEQMFQTLLKNEKINAMKWNGGIGEQQLIWLKHKLKKADSLNGKVILFCHFPVYPKNEHNLWNCEEVIELIESYDCVKAYISGHNHHGNYGIKNNIHYLTLKGMVETSEKNAYAIFEAWSDRLKIIGYGREENRTLILK